MNKTTFPYSEELLCMLLAEFGWNFEGMLVAGGYHPVTTGNCQHDDQAVYSPHVAGNELSGAYQNAAASCPHCYPGSNPATLVWSQKGNEIALYADKNSSKPERARALCQQKEKGIMAKIFHGDTVYKVNNADEAMETMYKIARQASGTFEGCSCSETGFYVDADDTVNLDGERKLYRIKGAADGKSYAETDNLNLLD